MKSVQNFFIRIRDTFYSPNEYKGVRSKSLGGLLGFFFLVALLTSAVVAVPLGIAMIAGVATAETDSFVADYYPENLEITIQDGVASTNQNEPFFVPIPEKDRMSEEFTNFLVIDTTPDITLETLESYQSVAILTQKNLIVRSEQEQRTLSLSDVGNVVINESLVQEWYGKVIGFVKTLVVPVAILMIPLIAGFALFAHAVASLVGALTVMGIALLRKMKITYGEAYKTALFGSVPILIFQTIAYMAGFIVVPFWLSLLLFITVVFVNLGQKNSEPEVAM